MKNLKNAVFEHLKTKKKYNTLSLKCDVLKDELQNKTTELGVERQIHRKEKAIWEQKLKDQEKDLIELKREIINLKNKKRGKKDEKKS